MPNSLQRFPISLEKLIFVARNALLANFIISEVRRVVVKIGTLRGEYRFSNNFPVF